MKKDFILAALLAISQVIHSQTWTGISSADWNDPSNWNPAFVPASGSDVVIPGSVSSGNWPSLANNTTIGGLSMAPGSSINVNGYSLSLTSNSAYIDINGATINNNNSSTDIVLNISTGIAGYPAYFRGNIINDNITINLTGSLQFYEGDASPSNQYNGNATFNINSGLTVTISQIQPSQFNGNLTINRTVAGTTILFGAGATITGNYAYTNNYGGLTYMGTNTIKTPISGTINIAASYGTPNQFEMYRLVNQVNGGSVNIQNSQGFYLLRDTLKVTSLSITGYKGYWANLFENSITGDLTIADDASNGGGYPTYFRNNVITGNTVYTNNGTNSFYETDGGSTASKYYGNTSFNANSTGAMYICNYDSSLFDGNLTINRTIPALTQLFNAGATITGDFSFTHNASGNTFVGSTSVRTSIGGKIHIAVNYSSPSGIEIYRLINQTTGDSIIIANSSGFRLQQDTFKLVSLKINGYRGNDWSYFVNNSITGSLNLSDHVSYTGGFVTYIRNNIIYGNSQFSISGSNPLYEADVAGTGNRYFGNLIISSAGGSLYIGQGDSIYCTGNLTVNRTASGFTRVFNYGATIGGNFALTNSASGATYLGNILYPTRITGTINIAINYTSPSTFEMNRLLNLSAGGSIAVQNPEGYRLERDTLIASSVSLTGYRGAAWAYLFNNLITGNFTSSDDASYTGGYVTYLRGNIINGNTIYTINGTNALYDADGFGTRNIYNGNLSYTSAGGNLYIAQGDSIRCTGNLAINRTAPGYTQAFNSGATIGGNFSYSNNTSGSSYLGSNSFRTSIGGTITIAVNYSTPDYFEMYRFINQTAGGAISIANSVGFAIQRDTLLLNSLSITGYRGVNYAYLYNNFIAGNLTTADDPSYTGGYATYIRNNVVNGNSSFTVNGTNMLWDTDNAGTANIYNGDVTYTRNNGGINVGQSDSTRFAKNFTLNSGTGITLGYIKFVGSSNGIVDQTGAQSIIIPMVIMDKTGTASITLNDPVTLSNNIQLRNGNIYCATGSSLIFPAGVFHSLASVTSHVIGVVTKLGTESFTFPVGSPISYNPIMISAPSDPTSNFRAQFINQNPNIDGYNTNIKAATISEISTAAYWTVQRVAGTDNVNLTLSFSSNPYEQYPVLANLKVVHWNGSQWDDHGNGGTTGTSSSGTVTNSVTIGSFSPFTIAGVVSTYYFKFGNPGPGPDGSPLKIRGLGGYAPYAVKQLPSGTYTADSIFLVANGSTTSFRLKDNNGVEKDTAITAPPSPVNYISSNGNGTVNFSGWRHYVYMRDGSNNIMGAIKDNNLTLGNTTMNTYFSAAIVATAPNGSFYLKRSFRIQSQYAPVGTRRVRLYISKTEFADLQAADPASFPAGINSLTITKYTGPDEDSLFNPIPGGNTIIIPNSAITITDLGTLYSLDIDVSGFSGFYIGGNQTITSLCPGSTISLPSNISGSTYQWQRDIGTGFENFTDGGVYSGTGTSTLTITNVPSTAYGFRFRCLVNGTTYSQIYTIKFTVSWQGTVSDVWENISNWSCGVLPDGNTDVVIGSGKPNYPKVNSSTSVRTLKINSGATVTVNTSVNFTVNK